MQLKVLMDHDTVTHEDKQGANRLVTNKESWQDVLRRSIAPHAFDMFMTTLVNIFGSVETAGDYVGKVRTTPTSSICHV